MNNFSSCPSFWASEPPAPMVGILSVQRHLQPHPISGLQGRGTCHLLVALAWCLGRPLSPERRLSCGVLEVMSSLWSVRSVFPQDNLPLGVELAQSHRNSHLPRSSSRRTWQSHCTGIWGQKGWAAGRAECAHGAKQSALPPHWLHGGACCSLSSSF